LVLNSNVSWQRQQRRSKTSAIASTTLQNAQLLAIFYLSDYYQPGRVQKVIHRRLYATPGFRKWFTPKYQALATSTATTSEDLALPELYRHACARAIAFPYQFPPYDAGQNMKSIRAPPQQRHSEEHFRSSSAAMLVEIVRGLPDAHVSG
jgi:hypothetical protein